MEHNARQQTASQWVYEYSDMLFSYTVHRVHDQQTAKDILQDTFLSAWKNIADYNGEASVKTWLFAILKNKIIDYYRKASTRFETERLNTTDHSPDFFDNQDHWASGFYPREWSNSGYHQLETNEFYAVLGNCRSRLKEIQNNAFTLRYLDGLDSEEICAILQITLSNYWVLVHRAKVQLRACLEKNWFFK